MKKIAVIGLYSIKNAGDTILCETTEYLIKQMKPDSEIVRVDVNPRLKKFRGIDAITATISKFMIKASSYMFKYENNSKFRYAYEYLMWWIKINRVFRKKLKDVDAIVFAGGGFLKFRTQGLNYYVEQIVKIAEKRNIPIMMNGVGIEGYDEKDIRCQRLKRAINKDCMKIITTRDDIDTLQKYYIVNKNIVTSRVGDPALWIPECYSKCKEENSTVVGINVIRGKVYQAYGNRLSEEQLLEFYKKLVMEVEKREWDWILFSNGMKADQVFGKKLLMSLNYDVEKKLLPAPKDTHEFLEIMKNFKCVFGARLHACITAYALNIPVVGLIWNEKLQIFSEVIGKKQNFFKETELNVEKIMETIENSFEDKYDDNIRQRLKGSTYEHLEKFWRIIDDN